MAEIRYICSFDNTKNHGDITMIDCEKVKVITDGSHDKYKKVGGGAAWVIYPKHCEIRGRDTKDCARFMRKYAVKSATIVEALAIRDVLKWNIERLSGVVFEVYCDCRTVLDRIAFAAKYPGRDYLCRCSLSDFMDRYYNYNHRFDGGCCSRCARKEGTAESQKIQQVIDEIISMINSYSGIIRIYWIKAHVDTSITITDSSGNVVMQKTGVIEKSNWHALVDNAANSARFLPDYDLHVEFDDYEMGL